MEKKNVKYLRNGQEVELLAKLPNNQYAVLILYEHYDEGFVREVTNVVDEIFDTPPTPRYNAEVLKLQAQIKELQEQKRNLEKEIREAEKIAKERASVYSQIPQLKLLDDFIAKKISHYVVDRYGDPEIVEFGSKDTRYERDLRLLVLFGKSNGQLNWRLNHYTDGSGGYNDVYPVTSYEEALETAKQIIVDKIKKTESSPSYQTCRLALKQGVNPDDIVPGYSEAAKKAAIDGKVKRIDELSRGIDTVQKEIQELMGPITPANERGKPLS